MKRDEKINLISRVAGNIMSRSYKDLSEAIDEAIYIVEQIEKHVKEKENGNISKNND